MKRISTRKRTLNMILALVLSIGFLLPYGPTAGAKKLPDTTRLVLTVRSSLNAVSFSQLELRNAILIHEIIRAKKESLGPNQVPNITDMVVALTQEGHEDKYFHMDRMGYLWEEQSMQKLVLPPAATFKLIRYANALRATHYGRLIRWEDAERIVPRKGIVSVTDLETGLSFRVQRRAGSDHADVQPITKEDTAIMKRIYGGRWSWKRRPIIVHSGQGRIAASMNGMPHGGDGIPENGFSGHFCIHFLGSTSHKSDFPDTAHQLMIYKASGNTRAFIEAASPVVLAESFVEAMYQRDSLLLRQVWDTIPEDKWSYFAGQLETLESIRIRKPLRKTGKSSVLEDNEYDESLKSDIRLAIASNKIGKPERNATYSFSFKRDDRSSPWRIADVAVK
ncbi:hypothetical protein [Cohnella lupini]|uniref:Uncharacterized protein n=1 Tax=Cohnella lupini TaxID=1294267 RepID=A0A3D9IWT9_9BACL|nr:hypothetical protein [Cohnella lupini]RED66290.1 hypothetical protein DFP95_101789 [Cohnella lupini]